MTGICQARRDAELLREMIRSNLGVVIPGQSGDRSPQTQYLPNIAISLLDLSLLGK